MKKRIAKKIESRNFDQDKFYENNAEFLAGSHSDGMDFWLTVKRYAKKTTSLKIAERAYKLHLSHYAKARYWKEACK